MLQATKGSWAMRAAVWLLCAWAGVHAASITAPTIELLPNTAGQQVTLTVSGGEQVAGANVAVQIHDGTAGPTVTAIDMQAGTIWGASALVDAGDFSNPRQVYRGVMTASGTVAASGTLAILTIDTTGVPGGTYPLLLAITVDGASQETELLDGGGSSIAVTLISGTLTVPGSMEPSVSIVATDPDAAEGTPVDTGTFTITRTGPTTEALTVNFTVSGSATAGSDYTALGTSVTIPAGSASVTLTVTPLDDTAVEGPETVIVTLAAGTGYTVGTPSSATVTIADNDSALPTVTIAATDAEAAEGSPVNTGTFTITRTGPTTAALTVNFTVSGTATPGSDYTALGTSVTIPAGSASATLTVTPIDDTEVEGAETVIVTLEDGTDYTVGTPSSATVTIADDDSAPVVSIVATDPDAAEGTPVDTGTFTITRTGPTTTALTVSFTVNGTATAGSDYTALGTSVTIPAGSASATLTVTPIDDTEVESAETVIVTLAAGTGYTVGMPNSATVTIADQAPVGTVVITAPTATLQANMADQILHVLVTGGAATSGLNLMMMVGDGSSGPAVTQVGLQAGTIWGASALPSDGGSTPYLIAWNVVTASGTVPADGVLATLTLSTVGVPAGSYPFTLTASYGGMSAATELLDGTGTPMAVTLVDGQLIVPEADQQVVTVAATANAMESPSTSGIFTITRTGPTTAPLTVQFSLTGTAQEGVDYTAVGTSVTIPAGQTSVTVPITPIDDAVVEGDETITLTLAPDPDAAYLIGTPAAATMNLIDGDAPVVTIEATDPNAAEGTPVDTGTFTITRTGATTEALTVNFTVTGTATADSDYTALGTSVTIPAGSATATLVVSPIDDVAVESAETVIVTLAAGAGYTVGTPSSATVTIADNDLPVVIIAATAPDALEGPTPVPGVITLTLSEPLEAPLAVNFTVSGTATAGTDYTALGTSVTIPAGESSVTLQVMPIDDAAAEGSETVIVTLAAGTGYTVGTPSSATVTIADDDSAPVVSIVATDPDAAEGTPVDTGTFTITRTGATTAALVVNFTVSGTATAGTDYTALGTSVTIPAGSASATLTVTPINDAVTEAVETVIVTLAAGTGYTVGTPSSATVTIADAANPTVTIVATDPDAAEGTPVDTGTFTITRTGATTAVLVVNFTVSGTATAGSDYTALGTSVTIPAGSASVTLTVTPVDDTAVEGPETVIVTLAAGTGYTVGTPSSATVTIADNDGPSLAAQLLAYEGLNYPLGSTMWDGGLGWAGPWTTGTSSGPVTLTAPGATISGVVSMGSVSLGGGAGVLFGRQLTQLVDNGWLAMVVQLTGPWSEIRLQQGGTTNVRLLLDGDESLVLAAADGSGGSAWADTGAPLATPALLVVQVDNGTVRVWLNPAAGAIAPAPGAALASSAAFGSRPVQFDGIEFYASAGVRVDEVRVATSYAALWATPSVVTISASIPQAAEGAPPIRGQVVITRTEPSAEPLTVTLALGGSATPGSDYEPLPATVTIPAGQTSITLDITPLADALPEPTETVIITLGPGTGYMIGAEAVAVISIADAPPATGSGGAAAGTAAAVGVQQHTAGCNAGGTLAVLVLMLAALLGLRRSRTNV